VVTFSVWVIFDLCVKASQLKIFRSHIRKLIEFCLTEWPAIVRYALSALPARAIAAPGFIEEIALFFYWHFRPPEKG
jgi:hypothetical protein